ncbi:hypothetical protein HPB49_010808 [Dermacentor silvarum]|uniref:Uncharacterized protein n=1 Tax=Dermacentor silvarum TaxID=543639 RepID=A0ACB8DZI9_DERSI|nr:hypothetical protein HPB49_010808 [Dermacentor silvarum]
MTNVVPTGMAGARTFTCELDASSKCPESVKCLRADLCTAEDAYEWISSYSQTTNTTWIVDWEVRNPKRMVFHKKWRCEHSNLNKTAGLKSTNCPAFVDIKIKALKEDHNHELNCADGLRLLRSSADTRATFHSYFKDGLAPAESLQLHQQKLAVEDDGVQQLANGALIPSANTVYHWFRMWRKDHYGDEVDPLSKLEEKAPLYHQNAYLTKPKPRPRSLTLRPPLKRPRELSCAREAVQVSASPTSTSVTAPEDDAAAACDSTSSEQRCDSACQTDNVVSCCCAAETNSLRCQLRAVRHQLARCQTMLAKMRVQVGRHKKMKQNLEKLTNRGRLVLDHCVMKGNAKSAKAVRYNKEWLYDCLLLKIKSTSVYIFLHENDYLPLPNVRTLYTYMKNLKADFGFDSDLFAVLKEKLLACPERERRDADHVLVFLFRPFLAGWSQTVGTFCTSSAAPGSVIAKLLLQCIVHLYNSGAVVDAVTCDNSTSNRSALRSLGICGEMGNTKTSFEHPCGPSRVVYSVIDPPHIFKCIRNNLLKVGKFLLPQGQEVYHSHYAALLEYEEEQAGLRAVPKLTKAHISPNAFQKMSVKLAVQADSLAVLLDDILLEPENSVEESSDLCCQESPKEHILEYLAGYVVKKFSSLKCSSWVNVSTTKSKDGNCWVVLVITRIMQWTQGLEAASEIIFLDSKASCDESQATVTVVLTATPVGAILIAVLMHNSQTTESYKTAFGLFKQKYPFCFGSIKKCQHVRLYFPDPTVIHDRQSAAEKAALKAMWPEASQLLCHFHVAQVEWRWLHASSSSISRDERWELMTAFQKVPSGQEDGKIYHVWQDVGTCTCRNGQQGAFCKHQALVHHMYGGAFPNAPILKPDDRHKLGVLALGDKCPDKSFFGSFREVLPELPSTSTAWKAHSQHAPEPQHEPIELDQHHLECSNSNEQRREDAAEVLKQIHEEEWRYYSLAADDPYYLTVLQQVLAEMKKVHKEPQVIASYLAQKAAFASARRRGRTIKVQPTGIARRRPGVGRGSGRVQEGRPSKHQGCKKTKRPHALHLSVKSGVPHAKSHGTGH